MSKALTARIIGYVASLILTLIAYLILVTAPLPLHLAVAIILTLAILQGVFQAVCFLHILSEKGPRWNLVVFISTLTILLIIILFSIWIMNHLNSHMM